MSPNLDKWTNRPSKYGALDAFVMGNGEPDSIISPGLLEEARRAVGRAVYVPVYDTESVSIGSTRSVTISDSEGTSALYQVSFTIYSFGFTMVPAAHMNNEMDYQRDWNRKFLKYLYKLGATLDSACLTALNANKSQVFGSLLGKYTDVSDVFTAAYANKDEVIGDLSAAMHANDIYGDYRLIGNPGMEVQIQRLLEKGNYNDTNRTIQLGDKMISYSNRIADASGYIATGYIFNPSSVGMVFRSEREAILGTKLPDGTEWSQELLPMLNIPIDTYFYYGVGDYNAFHGTSTADLTRGAKEHFGFAIEAATVVAYNDDLATYSNPIIKFQIAEEP